MTPAEKIASPAALRADCRAGRFDGPTSGHAPGHVQANMVILPADYADEFREFCDRNPQPCPVLEILEAGDPEPRKIAPGADVRTDLPRYRVFRNGEAVDDPTDVTDLWRDDLVTFMLGCSFIVEGALMEAGLVLAHIAETGFVPMYRTTRATVPAGRFEGPTVVSMRPFAPEDADRAADITAHYPMAHGGPIHIGDPGELGIRDIHEPEFGRAVTIAPGQTTAFWACGVTPQEALAAAKPPLAITHCPGQMFVADILSESTRI
ncbi:MAG: putative hydro-lyase [Rhodospirillaceae bacterium]|nr:putative hydro-lyase [Rhodospirillaceae bacterium]MBT5456366.1 putative hydro-lyase [Rhodospirillaceae bacterium]